MASGQLSDAILFNGTASGEWNKTKLNKRSFTQKLSVGVRYSFLSNNRKRLRHAADAVGYSSPVSLNPSKMLLSSSVIHKRKRTSTIKGRLNSDCSVHSSELEESTVTEENDVSNMKEIYP